MKRLFFDCSASDFGELVESPKGAVVLFDDARAEIDSRDARITQLEAAQQHGHAALTAHLAENAELKRKLANHAARLGTALKTRTELLGKLRERDARITALEAEAGVDRALLALADARLNREVLKTKGVCDG